MSFATTTLSAVESAISDILAGGAVKSYSINGRSFTREDLSALFEIRKSLQAEVAREGATSDFLLAKTSGGAVQSRFNPGIFYR